MSASLPQRINGLATRLMRWTTPAPASKCLASRASSVHTAVRNCT